MYDAGREVTEDAEQIRLEQVLRRGKVGTRKANLLPQCLLSCPCPQDLRVFISTLLIITQSWPTEERATKDITKIKV